MKNHIPNLITLLNLFSGCMGVVFIFTSDIRMASLMIFVSLLLDYMDGFAARLLNVRSAIGKELDSLADVVSFGVLPAMVVYVILYTTELGQWSFIAFIIAMMSAYRLARFNLDERQTENFIGMPTPANALFWSAFPLILFGEAGNDFQLALVQIMANPYLIIALVFIMSYLLVAELPLFSLKFKNFSWADNKERHIFLLLSIILILSLSYYALPFIILLYLLISVLKKQFIRS